METAIIVAAITALVTIIGIVVNRRGSREASEQARRAHQLREREVDWERRGDIIQDLNTEVERLRAIKRATQQSCSAAQAASIEVISLLQSVVRDEVVQEIAGQAVKEAKTHDDTHDHDV